MIIIIIFRFFAEYMLQTMGHVETILKFVAETYFCHCNNAPKSKRFDFTAVLQQHFFMLQEAKILTETQWGHLRFFSRACNATYHIISVRTMLLVVPELK